MTPENFADNPTMTLHECCEAMRANYISCSEGKICELLTTGQMPFGWAVAGEKSTVLISRCKFYRWLDDFIGAPAVRC